MNRLFLHTWLGKLTERLVDEWEKLFVWLLVHLKLGYFTGDISRVKISRAKVLWEEAQARGIKMEMFVLCGRQTDMYRARVGGQSIFFTGLPRLHQNQSDAELWLDDKAILKQKLEAAAIPVARGGCFSNYQKALEKFKNLQKPVIVKPRLGSRGRHTTTFIYTETELQQAYKLAKQLCYWVIVEEHLLGGVYRGTMIDGKLAGVLVGYPPCVVGDGVHSIRELIVIKNATKHPKVSEVQESPVMVEFLQRSGHALDEVLPSGASVDLSEKIGISYGGSNAEVTEETHQEIKKILVAAAAVVGDPLIGFDFIIPNITTSPHEQKWGIIECNGVPFIDLHHDPISGPPNNVAHHVWDLVERQLDSGNAR